MGEDGSKYIQNRVTSFMDDLQEGTFLKHSRETYSKIRTRIFEQSRLFNVKVYEGRESANEVSFCANSRRESKKC